MVKVFFENKLVSELVATFEDEETYIACFDTLKGLMRERRFDIITESIEEEEEK